MEHRHLVDPGLTAAAIDDIIERGTMADWMVLRDACTHDQDLFSKIERLTQARLRDPSEDALTSGHRFWSNYIEMERSHDIGKASP